jgi:hypothetical protein
MSREFIRLLEKTKDACVAGGGKYVAVTSHVAVAQLLSAASLSSLGTNSAFFMPVILTAFQRFSRRRQHKTV